MQAYPCCYDVIGDGPLYTNGDTPIPETLTNILAISGVNTDNLFAGSKGVSVYDDGLSGAMITKVKKAIKAPA